MRGWPICIAFIGAVVVLAFPVSAAPLTEEITSSAPGLFIRVQDNSTAAFCMSQCQLTYDACHNGCMLRSGGERDTCVGNCRFSYNACTQRCGSQAPPPNAGNMQCYAQDNYSQCKSECRDVYGSGNRPVCNCQPGPNPHCFKRP